MLFGGQAELFESKPFGVCDDARDTVLLGLTDGGILGL